MKKYKIFSLFLSLVLLFSSLSFSVYGADGNMDGDGGGMTGTGGSGSGWNVGNEAIRVTVVNKETKQKVGNAFNWSNQSWNGQAIMHGGVKTKLDYLAGGNLALSGTGFAVQKPATGIPSIISSSGASNISAVKTYFTDEGRIKEVANLSGLEYEKLISGEFTIILEPIAVFKYKGVQMALTATECALYDKAVGGALKATMGNLTHQNLPLAMFLEKNELGISAYGGGAGLKANEQIYKQLGIGTVNFDGELPEQGEKPPEEYDLEYHTDTDVIVAIKICTDSEINPDNAGRATFKFPNKTIAKEYVIPEGSCQTVWVDWHTPEEEGIIEVPVDVNGGNTDKATLRIKLVKVEENIPPDPQGRDRNDGYTVPPLPTAESNDYTTWFEWDAWWESKWEWESTGHKSSCDDDCSKKHGKWVDNGNWEFEANDYYARLTIVSAKIVPDERAMTASGQSMKSGYGLNTEVVVKIETNGGTVGGGNVTDVQYIITTFPEFNYKTYNRLLEKECEKWEFKENEYSQFKNRVHFTPVWYPDGSNYILSYAIIDTWTPAGQLYYVIDSDSIHINANVFDDWHTAPDFAK